MTGAHTGSSAISAVTQSAVRRTTSAWAHLPIAQSSARSRASPRPRRWRGQCFRTTADCR
ncbi:hypothetical protein F7234_21360 [Pseudomonas putida]|nr:hypothetical protein F7234_21360 [Pseudomonas putida]